MDSIAYTLIRKKNRKSLRLQVKDAQAFVLAPLNMSLERIDAFVASKRGWLAAHIERQRSALERFESIFSLDAVMLWGREYPVAVSGSAKGCRFSDGVFLLPLDARAKASAIKRFLVRTAGQRLKLILDSVSARCGVGYGVFKLSSARTSWGSCSKDKTVRLSWRLVMLDEKFAEYVAIHELCHTYYLNHSPKFWECVAKLCPDYKRIKKEMKDFGALCRYL